MNPSSALFCLASVAQDESYWRSIDLPDSEYITQSAKFDHRGVMAQESQSLDLSVSVRQAGDNKTVTSNMNEMQCRETLKNERARKFQCTFDGCEKTFTRCSKLAIHNLSHTGIKPHKCFTCSKAFSVKGNLKRHLLIHMGVKAYSCGECGQKFSEKGSLKQHRVLHSGERPHACSYCDAKFAQKTNLRTHIVRHTGETPFQCMVCDKKFSTRYQKKIHCDINTPEEPRKCTQEKTTKKLACTVDGCEPLFDGDCSLTKDVKKKHSITHSAKPKNFLCFL